DPGQLLVVAVLEQVLAQTLQRDARQRLTTCLEHLAVQLAQDRRSERSRLQRDEIALANAGAETDEHVGQSLVTAIGHVRQVEPAAGPAGSGRCARRAR